MTTLQHIIDGKNVTGTSETLFDIYDHSTGNITKKIKGASANDVQKAVKIANEKFASGKAPSSILKVAKTFS